MAANPAEKARALEQCERDLDVAIERLVNLRLDAADHDSDGGGGAGAHHHDVHTAATGAAAVEEEEEQRTVVGGAVHAPSDDDDIDDRAEWIERVVEAMASAGNWGDARARAATLLEGFGASVATACRAERDAALRQNGLLKMAVRVQQRLCYEKEVANRELQRLCYEKEAANRELQRQLAGCQDRVRSLEKDNYALSMYLRNALPKPQGGSITGRFHPEVF